MLRIITGILISYLIGSIPTAYIFGRVLKGIDIRKFGSGNIGATNAFRVLGKGPGILVLILDALKGVAAVAFVGGYFSGELLWISFGLSCVVGHIWTVFLGFKGGKGMATTLGVLIGLALKIPGLRIVLGITLLVWLLTFIVSRIVSLASIVSVIALPVLALSFKQSVIVVSLSVVLSLLVILRHKPNIKRLSQGKESRLV
ncbi:MAG: glycerol-3-phosphate 1-O-acyltransferase PlsY [Candidatus Omnitrophota bacterium]